MSAKMPLRVGECSFCATDQYVNSRGWIAYHCVMCGPFCPGAGLPPRGEEWLVMPQQDSVR